MTQKVIWDYYQGEGINSFDGSIERLRFLVEIARTRMRQNRPRTLNIGTGNGFLELMCARLGWQSYSLDPSTVAIERLQTQAIAGTVGLIEVLPHQHSVFDVVFCSEVLEHLTDQQLNSGLSEIRRILHPEGLLIGTVPFAEYLQNGLTVCPDCGKQFHRWGHHQSFDRERLGRLLESNGFSVIALDTHAFPHFPERSTLTMIKSHIVKILGRFGMPTSFPVLVFVAKKAN